MKKEYFCFLTKKKFFCKKVFLFWSFLSSVFYFYFLFLSTMKYLYCNSEIQNGSVYYCFKCNVSFHRSCLSKEKICPAKCFFQPFLQNQTQTSSTWNPQPQHNLSLGRKVFIINAFFLRRRIIHFFFFFFETDFIQLVVFNLSHLNYIKLYLFLTSNERWSFKLQFSSVSLYAEL